MESAEDKQEITHPWMPDVSLICGTEWLAGDSFMALPQNGNDAANVLLNKYRKLRSDARTVKKVTTEEFEAAWDVLRRKFTDEELEKHGDTIRQWMNENVKALQEDVASRRAMP